MIDKSFLLLIKYNLILLFIEAERSMRENLHAESLNLSLIIFISVQRNSFHDSFTHHSTSEWVEYFANRRRMNAIEMQKNEQKRNVSALNVIKLMHFIDSKFDCHCAFYSTAEWPFTFVQFSNLRFVMAMLNIWCFLFHFLIRFATKFNI